MTSLAETLKQYTAYIPTTSRLFELSSFFKSLFGTSSSSLNTLETRYLSGEINDAKRILWNEFISKFSEIHYFWIGSCLLSFINKEFNLLIQAGNQFPEETHIEMHADHIVLTQAGVANCCDPLNVGANKTPLYYHFEYLIYMNNDNKLCHSMSGSAYFPSQENIYTYNGDKIRTHTPSEDSYQTLYQEMCQRFTSLSDPKQPWDETTINLAIKSNAEQITISPPNTYGECNEKDLLSMGEADFNRVEPTVTIVTSSEEGYRQRNDSMNLGTPSETSSEINSDDEGSDDEFLDALEEHRVSTMACH